MLINVVDIIAQNLLAFVYKLDMSSTAAAMSYKEQFQSLYHSQSVKNIHWKMVLALNSCKSVQSQSYYQSFISEARNQQ